MQIANSFKELLWVIMYKVVASGFRKNNSINVFSYQCAYRFILMFLLAILITRFMNQKLLNYFTIKHIHTHPHTHNNFTALWDNLSEPVPETFTHSHLSWLSIILYLLLPSPMIHGILLDQFTCLTVQVFSHPFSALMLLVGWQKWHPACNNRMLAWLCVGVWICIWPS